MTSTDAKRMMELKKSMIADYPMEYRKRFPHKIDRFVQLAEERCMVLVSMAAIDEGFEAFTDFDFAPERFYQRWNTPHIEELHSFLNRPELKDGDIWSRDPTPYLCKLVDENRFVKENYQQILRNTPNSDMKFQFGKTYVGIGFVDLSQLLWGEYQSEEGAGTLLFHGYDQAEVTVARSVLIYEMMKTDKRELSDKTILQVWFSSCWDRETQEQFFSFLHKHVPRINNGLLSKYAPIWKRKRGMTARQAQELFTRHQGSNNFLPLSNLLNTSDQVQFANYLFTGYLFVDYDCLQDAKFGNVTMFPSGSENWFKKKYEDFFSIIDINSSSLNSFITRSKDPLIEQILKLVSAKLNTLRTFIQNSKIVCNLKVKDVNTKDFAFAKEVQNLDAFFIDWSNIPDYLPRLDFIEFARKCSGPETVHQFHTMNWTYKVYGASYYDYKNRRQEIEAIYKNVREKMEPNCRAIRSNKPELARLIRIPRLNFATNQFSVIAVNLYGEKYLKHVMTDKNRKVLNFIKTPYDQFSQLFGDNDRLIICTFSFNDDLILKTNFI